jgi:multiple sugar transport system ATP-binding protein
MVLPLDRAQFEAARTNSDTPMVTIGFRPEETDLVGQHGGGMPVTVDLVEELGSDALVYGTVALEGQNERFVVRTDSRRAPHLGEIVYVKPHADRIHAFNAVTGARL